MTKSKILLVGGGGHCKSVIDTIHSSNSYDEIEVIDLKEKIGSKILSSPIIGEDKDLEELFKKGYKNAFISLGSVGNPSLRIKLQKKIKSIGYKIPTIIDKSSIVSKTSQIGEGVFIGKNVVINVDAVIGDGAIINTGSLVEHECIVGDFVHLAPGSLLSGKVKVGNNTHIGAGSVVRQNINIGENSLIGMGSIVLKDIKSNTLAYGNPCREVDKR